MSLNSQNGQIVSGIASPQAHFVLNPQSHTFDYSSQTNALESSGLKAFFCPCFVYGKTQHRLNKDPNLMGYSRFNNDVCRYLTNG